MYAFKNLNLHVFKHSYMHSTRIFKRSNMCSEIQSFIWHSEMIKSSKCRSFMACIHSSIFIKTSIKSDSSSNYIYEEWALRRIFIFKFSTVYEEWALRRIFILNFSVYEEWALRRIFISNFQHLWRMDSASYLHFKLSNIYEEGALRRIFISNFQHLWRNDSTSYLYFKFATILSL